MLAWAFVFLRLFAIGAERALLKRLGNRSPHGLIPAFWFFALPALALLPWGWTLSAKGVPSGVLLALATALYIRALREGELSRLAPLSSLSYGFLFLMDLLLGKGKAWGAPSLLGLLLIMGGSASLYPKGPSSLLFLPRLGNLPGGKPMLLYAFLLATQRQVDAKLVPGEDPLSYSASAFLTVAVLLGLLLGSRHDLPLAVAFARRNIFLLVAAGGNNLLTFLLALWALPSVPLSLQEPLMALSHGVTALLARLFFGEDLRGRLGGIGLIILGSALILGDPR
ncbi:MAG: EamA family transporter [Clostridiales bacterium]|nr:EamA family transporter [Clostridiales bacterium]